MVVAWLWGLLLVGALVTLAVGGMLVVRRRIGVDELKLNNEVAGFIYAVVGVLYAVVLGFTAIIVWERFDNAQAVADQEANALADLYRDARVFPLEVRKDLEARLRGYATLVAEKEWAAMAAHRPSPETWEEYNRLWETYHRYQPQTEHERIWYAQSLTKLNELGDLRRLRLLSSRSEGVPVVMWIVLVGVGVITIGFSFLFATKSTGAQVLMTAGLAFTIGLVLLSIMALEQPFSGITRVQPESFHQAAEIFERWSLSAGDPPPQERP